MKKNLIWRGAATALITPMKDGKIDFLSLGRLIEMQIAEGIAALVIGGTTAEAATLTDTERYEIFEFSREKVEGRVKLIFGTGTNDTRTAIAHTKKANEVGCDGVLVVTPYYNKGTHRGVTEHYKRIAAASDAPVILYNVPGRTGVNLTLWQLEELAGVENIVALKEASDSADRLARLAEFGDELYLYAGNDSQIYATLSLGGKGVISVISNLYPKRISALCDGFFEGRWDFARDEQLKMLDFIDLMFRETNPVPIKYAMSLKGLCSPEVRLPLFEAEKATRDAISTLIDRF